MGQGIENLGIQVEVTASICNLNLKFLQNLSLFKGIRSGFRCEIKRVWGCV